MAANQPNIVLAGFMGTGKSTVGRALAGQLGWQFVDTDEAIEAATGLPVREIFARHGEAVFRRYEREACEQVAASTGQVIAVGGGGLLDPANRAALEASGVIVLLACRPDVLAGRLAESARRGERPLLAGNIEETIARLLAQRAQVYSSVQLQVDTTDLTPDEVARQVLAFYNSAVQTGAYAGAL